MGYAGKSLPFASLETAFHQEASHAPLVRSLSSHVNHKTQH